MKSEAIIKFADQECSDLMSHPNSTCVMMNLTLSYAWSGVGL
jgi:hypothetical protein